MLQAHISQVSAATDPPDALHQGYDMVHKAEHCHK